MRRFYCYSYLWVIAAIDRPQIKLSNAWVESHGKTFEMLDEEENSHVVVFQDRRLRHAWPVVEDGVAADLGIAVTDHARYLDRKI